MRPHSVILRQISEQKLDPRVPHVSHKNGILVPKKSHLEKDEDEALKESPVEETEKSSKKSEKKFPFHPPIPSQEESAETILEKPKKKAPPPKKKKSPIGE
jgi:cytoskeletal protein RodZ